MSLASFFQPGRLALSYELFPPKTPKGEELMYDNIVELMNFSPDFITCTYGAGGSTRSKTLEIVSQVKKRFRVPVASHLTLVGSTADELKSYLHQAREVGVDYIVALRGDPPAGQTEFTQTSGGFRYANELVELIHSDFNNFGVLVAGYPETHREAVNAQTDLENLKRKVDAGADVVVTQLFFDNTDFFRFRDACDVAGIQVPIVPGLLPVTSLPQIERIASLCGAKLPAKMMERLQAQTTPEGYFEVGVDWAIRQTQELIEAQIPGLHFYVLNQSPATLKILNSIQAETLRGHGSL
jgi:methylenetetrahydrofolate reductase (NADPH)